MMLSALAAMALLGRVRAKRPRRNAI
jgi:hypothetical protein